MKRLLTQPARLMSAALTIVLFAGADWPQFRGADNASTAEGVTVPTTWSETENVAWKADLVGRGVSGPIVVAGKTIVTASSGYAQDRLHVLCFDSQSGEPLWSRQFWATGRTMCHPTSAVAANTPASDGERIFAFYSSNDLACLDLEGNLLWYRGLTHDFPAAANDVGLASSPLVVGKTVVVQIENQADSFAMGFDTQTGETRWRLDRPRLANWTSPIVLRGQDRKDDVVLLQCSTGLTAHAPDTGKELWSHEAGCSTIPSATVSEGVIFVPANGLTALRPEPGSKSLEILWEANKLRAGSGSPVVHGGCVYSVDSGGILNCGDAASGDVLWELRLGGTFWATPVIAGEHLYAVNADGVGYVVGLAGEKGEIVAQNELGEGVLGSPAVADGALYLRSEAHLWKIQ